jgi:hypothetical protein
MGRPSKLTDRQWEEIGKRILEGEKPSDLAREFKVSPAAVSQRFSKSVKNVKAVANQLVAADTALKALPVSEQVQAVSLAQDLIAMSTHLAGAGKYGAATAHRLNGIVHAKVQEIDDAEPLTGESLEALKGIAVLTKLANESSHIAVNILAANKDEVRRLREGETGDKAQLLKEIAAALPN